MDYARYTGLKDNAKTIFVAGIVSALSVDTASNELKIEWIEKELKQLEEELNKIETNMEKILPDISGNRSNDKRLKIWSAS